MTTTNTQTAPYPEILADLVRRCRYRDGWRTYLIDDMVRDPADTHSGESRGLTLIIQTATVNSYDQDQRIAVRHIFPVPPATYDERSWRRWLLNRFIDVEAHEACEFFVLVETNDAGDQEIVHPFAPSHGPGNDPYLIREIATDEDRRTSFRGQLNP